MTLAALVFLVTHPVGWLIGISAIGLVGMAIQQNLGTFNLNAWQQTLQLSGSSVNTDATVGAHTLAPNVIAGFGTNYLLVTAAGGVNLTTRTANQIIADYVALVGFLPAVGAVWEFQINNTGGGTVTLVGGTGVTIVGTATVANNTSRLWLASYNGGAPNQASVTITNVASGTV